MTAILIRSMKMKICALITILLVFAPALAVQDASDAQKKEFIELLETLPTKGEFYTKDAGVYPSRKQIKAAFGNPIGLNNSEIGAVLDELRSQFSSIKGR